MKFPRNARIFRGHLDAAPFAGVFFLLIIFVLLASLIYTPGVLIELPVASAGELSGGAGPIASVAVARNGQLYYENQLVQKNELRRRLRNAGQKSQQPLTLVVLADKDVKYEQCVELAALARDPTINIKQVLLETLPRIFDEPAKGALRP